MKEKIIFYIKHNLLGRRYVMIGRPWEKHCKIVRRFFIWGGDIWR